MGAEHLGYVVVSPGASLNLCKGNGFCVGWRKSKFAQRQWFAAAWLFSAAWVIHVLTRAGHCNLPAMLIAATRATGRCGDTATFTWQFHHLEACGL